MASAGPVPRYILFLQGILLLPYLSFPVTGPLALHYVINSLHYFGEKWWEPGEEESAVKLHPPAGPQTDDSCLLLLHFRAQVFSV